jgi:hypothetical protein
MSGDAKTRSSHPAEVFLSHSHHDQKLLLRVAGELRRHGVSVWYSQHGIVGAQKWISEIGKALGRCDWFIVLLTPNAVKSVWVEREVTMALTDHRRYNGRIIPVLARKCRQPQFMWPLAGVQMISFTLRRFEDGIRDLLRVWGITYRAKKR